MKSLNYSQVLNRAMDVLTLSYTACPMLQGGRQENRQNSNLCYLPETDN